MDLQIPEVFTVHQVVRTPGSESRGVHGLYRIQLQVRGNKREEALTHLFPVISAIGLSGFTRHSLRGAFFSFPAFWLFCTLRRFYRFRFRGAAGLDHLIAELLKKVVEHRFASHFQRFIPGAHI